MLSRGLFRIGRRKVGLWIGVLTLMVGVVFGTSTTVMAYTANSVFAVKACVEIKTGNSYISSDYFGIREEGGEARDNGNTYCSFAGKNDKPTTAERIIEVYGGTYKNNGKTPPALNLSFSTYVEWRRDSSVSSVDYGAVDFNTSQDIANLGESNNKVIGFCRTSGCFGSNRYTYIGSREVKGSDFAVKNNSSDGAEYKAYSGSYTLAAPTNNALSKRSVYITAPHRTYTQRVGNDTEIYRCPVSSASDQTCDNTKTGGSRSVSNNAWAEVEYLPAVELQMIPILKMDGKQVSGLDVKTFYANYGKGRRMSATTNATGYDFKGFAATKNEGKQGTYITTTNSNNNPYLNDSNTITYKNVRGLTKFYAVYEPKGYKLTIDEGTGSKITVRRTATERSGASTNSNLSNNANIYYQDELEICFAVNSDYILTTHTVNDSTWTSCKKYTVTGNTKVVSRAKLEEYTLTRKTIDTSCKAITEVTGGTESDTKKVGAVATVKSGSKTGWDFKGWVGPKSYAENKDSGNCTSYYKKTSNSETYYISGSGTSPALSNFNYNVKSSVGDHDIYAVFAPQKRTLKAEARDQSGNKLEGVTFDPTSASVTVNYGSSASIKVNKDSKAGYTFMGWVNETGNASKCAKDTSKCDGGVKVTYKDSSLTKNYTEIAVFKKNDQFDLKAKPCSRVDGADITGVSWSGASWSDSVESGTTAKVTRGTNANYEFLGWSESSSDAKNGKFVTATSGNIHVSGSSSPKESYNAKITSSKTGVCAVYLSKYKLTVNQGTGTKITVNRTASSPYKTITPRTISNGATLYYGDKLSSTCVPLSGYVLDTQSFRGYGINNTSSCTISNHEVKADVTVSATAKRPNQPEGRARVSGGTSVNTSATTFLTTGWTNENQSKTTEIRCANSGGCDVAWDFGLNETTNYTITRRVGSGSWASVASGSGKGDIIKSYTEKVAPNVTVCYKMEFNGVSLEVCGKVIYIPPDDSSSFVGVVGAMRNGTEIVTTGAQSTTTTKNKTIEGCVSGCSVTFNSQLIRKAGVGKTTYSITFNGNKVKNNVEFNSVAGTVHSETITLMPKDEVCEVMTFKPAGASSTATATLTACVKAAEVEEGTTSFSGKVGASYDDKVVTNSGWRTATYTTPTGEVEGCEGVGCEVSFDAQLLRGSTTGTTTYSVVFNGNTIRNNQTFSGKIFNPESVGNNSKVRLYPGDEACMVLTFKQTTTAANNTTVKTCVKAKKIIPPDPVIPEGSVCSDWAAPSSYLNSDQYNGTTSTISNVRNLSVSKYSNWMGTVYAKPNDKIDWGHCYYPGVQTTAKTLVTTNESKNTHDSNPPYSSGSHRLSSCSEWDSSCNPDVPSYPLLFSELWTQVDGWRNEFKASSEATSGDGVKIGFYSSANNQGDGAEIGKYDAISFSKTINYAVENQYAGSTLTEGISTSSPAWATVTDEGAHSWSCEWKEKGQRTYCPGGYDGHSGAYVEVEQEDGTKTSECPGGEQTGTIYGWSSTCGHQEHFVSHNQGGTASSKANVIVPYNFINTVDEVKPYKDDDIAFAGETATVDFTIVTNSRYNNETEGNYATRVDNAYFKVEVCYLEDGVNKCVETTPEGVNGAKKLNTEYQNRSELSRNTTVSLPDVPAGTEVCMGVAVYPKDSGNDRNIKSNYYNINSRSSWNYSTNKACFTIAKKPSLQIWGGNIFSNGAIATSTAKKINITGVNTYSPDNKSISSYFGSWGELGVMSIGPIVGFGSGASMGYALNNNGTLVPRYSLGNNYQGVGNTGANVGGGTASAFCIRSPLTFANRDRVGICRTDVAGSMFGDNSANKIKGDRESVVSRYIDALSSHGDAYYHMAGDVDVAEVERLNDTSSIINTTLIIHAGGNVVISKDITYGLANKVYTNLEEIPKIIIYAEKDIKINCGVSRIDALVVAEGEVRTCSDSDNIHAEKNSQQLRINGAVITRNLVADRTYGAATGANSIIPAEIIDFDPTLYLLGSSQVETGGDEDEDGSSSASNMNITYFQESAPRY